MTNAEMEQIERLIEKCANEKNMQGLLQLRAFINLKIVDISYHKEPNIMCEEEKEKKEKRAM